MRMQAISPEEAALALQACAGLDPEGLDTPESAARAGHCFRLRTKHGIAVLSVGQKDGALWCYAAAGEGQGLTPDCARALESIARAAGLRRVAFQTMRQGLVKKTLDLGYHIAGPVGTGYQMTKELS